MEHAPEDSIEFEIKPYALSQIGKVRQAFEEEETAWPAGSERFPQSNAVVNSDCKRGLVVRYPIRMREDLLPVSYFIRKSLRKMVEILISRWHAWLRITDCLRSSETGLPIKINIPRLRTRTPNLRARAGTFRRLLCRPFPRNSAAATTPHKESCARCRNQLTPKLQETSARGLLDLFEE